MRRWRQMQARRPRPLDKPFIYKGLLNQGEERLELGQKVFNIGFDIALFTAKPLFFLVESYNEVLHPG